MTNEELEGVEEQPEEIVEEVVEEEPKVKINAGDDMSDLFEPPSIEDEDMETADLVEVNMEEDVMGGDLSDLVEVENEDITSDEFEQQETPRQKKAVKRTRKPYHRPYTPPTSIQGFR